MPFDVDLDHINYLRQSINAIRALHADKRYFATTFDQHPEDGVSMAYFSTYHVLYAYGTSYAPQIGVLSIPGRNPDPRL
jgi:hypothetical protein